jgi:MoaA/NifB/PqqE/SkfB family radical SAM enzyme
MELRDGRQASLAMSRVNGHAVLQAGERRLPVRIPVLAAIRDMLTNPAEADGLAVDPSPHWESIRAFIRFYFFDEGALESGTSYPEMVLPEALESVRLRPESLSFLITKQCNFKCLHCYNDSGVREDGELSSLERMKVASYLGRWGVPTITLTGGEPFLSRDTISVLELLASYRTFLKVSTNAWHLPDEALEMVRSRAIRQMNISLDGGNAETHDNYRKVRGSFERVLKTLARLQEAKVEILNLNVAVYDHNLDQLDDVCQIALRFGAHAIAFKAVTSSGRADAPPETFLTAAGIQQFRRVRDVLHGRYGRSVMMSAPIVSAAVEEPEQDAVQCGGGTKAMFIGSNGDLLPCELIKPFIDVPNVRHTAPLVAWFQGKGFDTFRGFVTEGTERRRDGWSGCPAANLERRKRDGGVVAIRPFRQAGAGT